MDELDLQGKKYISSKRAAEITGYAKDYVGQLARGGKVPATRVGRAWYVELESIKRHAGVEEVQQVQGNPSRTLSLTTIPRESLTPLHALQLRGTQATGERLLNTWGKITYHHDESDLLPAVKLKNKDEIPVAIRVDKKKILQSMNMSPVHTVQTTQLDGLRVPTPKNISVPLKVEQPRKTQLPVYIGASVVVACAVVVIGLGGFYTPREWFLGLEGSQTASSADFGVILDYFSVLFVEGVSLIADFLSLLIASLGAFFEAGLLFLLSFF